MNDPKYIKFVKNYFSIPSKVKPINFKIIQGCKNIYLQANKQCKFFMSEDHIIYYNVHKICIRYGDLFSGIYALRHNHFTANYNVLEVLYLLYAKRYDKIDIVDLEFEKYTTDNFDYVTEEQFLAYLECSND